MASADAFLDEAPAKQSADSFLDEEPSPKKPAYTMADFMSGDRFSSEAERASAFKEFRAGGGKVPLMSETGVVPADAIKGALTYTNPVGLGTLAAPDTAPAKIVKGVIGGTSEALSGFTTPEGLSQLAIMPTGKVAQILVTLGFGAEAVRNIPDQLKAWNETDDPQEKAKIATGMAVSLGLPVLGTAHALGREAVPKVSAREELSPKEVAPTPDSSSLETSPSVLESGQSRPESLERPTSSQKEVRPEGPEVARQSADEFLNEGEGLRPETPVVPDESVPSRTDEALEPSTKTAEDVSDVGIAHRFGEDRFEGQIERGEGRTVEDQVARGRELLTRGVDPGQIIRRVDRTGRISGDDMAVLRASLEQHQHAADTAAEAARRNPGDPVLKRAAEQAMQNELAWRKAIKPAATVFHEIGMTLQGSAEVNYGTFEGLRRSAFDLHGKDVTPEQAGRLKGVADNVRRETQLATESLQRSTEQVERAFGRKKPPRSVDQLRNDLAAKIRELTPC